jgi:transcriptional regulator with XRE-family HTH domain
LGEAIRTCRKRASFSQEKLAEKADLSPVFISRVECGKENISVDALVRLAKALGVHIGEFFSDF